MKDAFSISIPMPKELWSRVKVLAQRNDVSANFVVRRALEQVTKQGRIPWPTTDDEAVSHEKFGEATPIYDKADELPVKGSRSGQKGRATPAA